MERNYNHNCIILYVCIHVSIVEVLTVYTMNVLVLFMTKCELYSSTAMIQAFADNIGCWNALILTQKIAALEFMCLEACKCLKCRRKADLRAIHVSSIKSHATIYVFGYYNVTLSCETQENTAQKLFMHIMALIMHAAKLHMLGTSLKLQLTCCSKYFSTKSLCICPEDRNCLCWCVVKACHWWASRY